MGGRRPREGWISTSIEIDRATVGVVFNLRKYAKKRRKQDSGRACLCLKSYVSLHGEQHSEWRPPSWLLKIQDLEGFPPWTGSCDESAHVPPRPARPRGRLVGARVERELSVGSAQGGRDGPASPDVVGICVRVGRDAIYGAEQVRGAR